MFPFCKECVVRQCASAKTIQNCAECEDFEACDKIKQLLAMFSSDGIRKVMKLMHDKAMAACKEAAAAAAQAQSISS